MQVDFVIGGTQKGGTSALAHFLSQHPNICMSYRRKEMHYFDSEQNFSGAPDYTIYHSYFQPDAKHHTIGDCTPIYMYWEPAAWRIWKYNPRMKWILLLRNPVYRAFSAWNMESQRGAENISFREAVEREVVRCRSALPLQHRVFSYLDRGYYANQVRRLFHIFGRENCLVILSEDLKNHHPETLRTVFEFLGVDADIEVPTARVFQQTYAEKLDPELHCELLNLYYCDIRELEKILRQDLSSWYSKVGDGVSTAVGLNIEIRSPE